MGAVMVEPKLRQDDRECWASWLRAGLAHSKTQAFARRVDRARAAVLDAMVDSSNPCVMWSAGKDSTMLTHLVSHEVPGVRVYSEKDDLDYPGELEYVSTWGESFGVNLEVLTPPVSPATWLATNGHLFRGYDDMHSRAASLSKACFYGVVEAASAKHDLVFLGLRTEESRGRRMNRACRGLVYDTNRGQRVAQPIADFRGLDVMAYAVKHGIDLFAVYQCVALMHSREPWHLRKSWWLPGSHSARGGVSWLAHYYPSLYTRLCSWLPGTRELT